MDDKLLTEKQAAEFLNIGLRTLQRFRYAGEGPVFYQVGGAIRYSMDDLRTWLEQNKGG